MVLAVVVMMGLIGFSLLVEEEMNLGRQRELLSLIQKHVHRQH